MDAQNYLIVNLETQLVENIVLWDGSATSWQPPTNSIALIQSQTPSKIWMYSQTLNSFEMVEVLGEGQIGFSWDGEFVITNQSPPQIS